jgi:phage FluMu protein Com
MLESLRIKCPSCGIALEIRNSKNEAVKRINCPRCKKLLAINFEEEVAPQKSASPLGLLYYGMMCLKLQEGVNPLPLEGSEHIEVRGVRLTDGSSKCIVKALTAEEQVMVNGQPLMKDDEVVLSTGDEMQLGDAVLSFGVKKEPSVQPSTPPTPPMPSKRSARWPYLAAILCLAFGLSVWKLWPERPAPRKINVAMQDSSKRNNVKVETKTVKKDKPRKQEKETPEKVVESPLSRLSDMELETKAQHSVEAQYEIGKRKVKRGDSISIVLGTNFLKKAAKNGSSDAKEALQKVYNSLESDAAAGNTHAKNLLEVIK